MVKKLFLTIALVFCLTGVSYAGSITLEWDANTEPDLSFYNLYYDTNDCTNPPYDGIGATEGDSPIMVLIEDDENSDPTIFQYTINAVEIPAKAVFVVTAVDTSLAETGYSNEAWYCGCSNNPLAKKIVTNNLW